MENKILCQVCKKRKAYKKLVSNIDDSFFIVCKKKKCIEELYEKSKSHVTTIAKTPQEFVNAVRWNRNENQGRTYNQVKTNTLMVELSLIALTIIIFVVIMYGLFKLAFQF